MPTSSIMQSAYETTIGIVTPRTGPLQDSHQEALWRGTIKDGIARNAMTADVVEAYAGLLLQTEAGAPVRPAPHHRLWLELLCDDRIDSLLIMAPPEAAKTTWIISAWAGCHTGFYPEDPIIVTSATGPIARKRTLSLRNQTQSASWQATFRNVRRTEGMIWHHEEWSISPFGIPRPGRIHPTASAFGVDGSVTGARGRVVCCDDMVTRENSSTPGQRTKVKEFTYSTLLPRRFEIGRTLVIGTPYHPDDVYADFRDSGQFVICETPQLGEGALYYARVTYPDDWAHETLGEPARGRDE